MITNSTRVTFENGTTIEVDKGTSLYELSRKKLIDNTFSTIFHRYNILHIN